MEELHSSDKYVRDGSVDLHGHSVIRAHTGTLKASLFIIGVEIAERFAHAGISSNLINYLTSVLNESTATAASNVNIWSGVQYILPFLGAFVADSYLGRYWTILVASLVYLLGLILVTLSVSLRSLKPSLCKYESESCSRLRSSQFKIGFFFFSLYLVALGSGGHKPSLQAFGADQFDDENPKEKKHKSSFFNWWFFGICLGSLAGVTLLVYVQDNIGWGVGFAIPAVTMAMSILVFLCGTRVYRNKLPGGSPLTRVIHVFVAAFYKRNAPIPFREQNQLASIQEEESLIESRRQLLKTKEFRFLDKATIEDELDFECKTTRNWRVCTVQQVEEVKLLLGMLPIWMACLMYGVVVAQSSTFFTKQGSTMDRKISRHFVIPSASMQCFICVSIMLLVPVYDRFFVPIARRLSGNERGISLLQRIGTGMFVSVISMIVAAGIEIKRVKTAKGNGLIDVPSATIPISIFWLLPQYVLFGMADVFTMVGMQEYFYDQMPDTMKSLGIAVYLSVIGVGSFLSSFLILIIEKVTCRKQEHCWFTNNLNRSHLDYFYWLLASLSLLSLGIFMTLASCYKYKKTASTDKENAT
ncbi:protein NRT1/ PTR FAMILY 5.10 isoform X1 [Cryptomeria japonica]|uniref:protein NRT1/ PTR FAMILY 5.10 isoform X1 n=1 Tax=Cryptomeria japonica TaxID=3369 RepID=UPI0027DA7557|nr:protein NRT1/ PTR FAMILY 5.10 isoform X1 [Cryptomeria japonica]